MYICVSREKGKSTDWFEIIKKRMKVVKTVHTFFKVSSSAV